MTEPNATLTLRWSETRNNVEHRVFQAGDQFALVTRLLEASGRPKGYGCWRDFDTLEAARDGVPSAEEYALSL